MSDLAVPFIVCLAMFMENTLAKVLWESKKADAAVIIFLMRYTANINHRNNFFAN